MKKALTRGLIVTSTVLLVARAYTYAEGPPAERTGAPSSTRSGNELTCNSSNCHDEFELNSGGGSVTFTGVPESYVPGATYQIFVQVAKEGQSRWGFEATAKTSDRTRGGEFNITDTTNTQVIDVENAEPTETTPRYVQHTEAGTAAGTPDESPRWSFEWIAPPAGSGPVTFYAAGNAANGDEDNEGDYIYTTSVASAEGSATPTVVFGDLNGDRTVNVVDATLALQITVGIIQPTADQLRAGDVAPPGAPNGKIDVADATRILRRAVSLEPDPFP